MIDVQLEFEELYTRYIDDIYRICYAYCKRITDIEDILQNTFSKLYTSRNEFQEYEDVKRWLIRVAINNSRDVMRTRWWDYTILSDFHIKKPKNIEYDLNRYLQKLPSKTKTVIVLFYYEEFSTADIALIMDMNISTVRTHLQRGRERLKKYMEEDSDHAVRRSKNRK